MTQSTRATLRAARELIADQEHWTFGDLAIENTGMACDPLDSAAYAWCAEGALVRAAGGNNKTWEACAYELSLAARYLFPEINGAAAHVAVNDGEAGIPEGTTCDDVMQIVHANIISVFDHAIMVAEGSN